MCWISDLGLGLIYERWLFFRIFFGVNKNFYLRARFAEQFNRPECIDWTESSRRIHVWTLSVADGRKRLRTAGAVVDKGVARGCVTEITSLTGERSTAVSAAYIRYTHAYGCMPPTRVRESRLHGVDVAPDCTVPSHISGGELMRKSRHVDERQCTYARLYADFAPKNLAIFRFCDLIFLILEKSLILFWNNW